MFQNGCSSSLLLKICVTVWGESPSPGFVVVLGLGAKPPACLKNTEYPKLEDQRLPTSCRGDVHDPATEQPTWKYFTLLTLEHPQSLSLLPSSIVCDPAAKPPVTTHHHHDAESRNDEEASSGRRLGDPLDEPPKCQGHPGALGRNRGRPI